MINLQISEKEFSAIHPILLYWKQNWDWECPILFGLQDEEFEAIATQWPETSNFSDKQIALAIWGAVREILGHGAMKTPDNLEAMTGLNYAECEALFEKIKPKIKEILA